MTNTELARQILERNGEMRAMDVGSAILAAGSSSPLSAAALGGDACKALAKSGRAIRVRRGVYGPARTAFAVTTEPDKELVGIPQPGKVGSGQMARLIAAADEYGREMVAAMDLSGPGMEKFLCGCHRELSKQVAILQMVEKQR